MEVIILAGGMGTRLQSVVLDVPKPMAPIHNKPFLFYILTWLENNYVTRAIISIGYKAEFIKKEFGNRFNSIELVYSFEESPLGTGGAIALAMTKVKEDKILIINGDSFFKINLKKFMTFHCSGNFDFSVALKPVKKTGRYGTVEIDSNNKIVNFKEKANFEKGLINGGVYIFNCSISKSLPSSSIFSFEERFMAEMFKKLSFGGMVQDSYFIDIGIPEDYIRAQKELSPL